MRRFLAPNGLPDHLQKRFALGDDLRRQGYRGRFAPTPSGPLHLGNLRTALMSWLVARRAGGRWLLRIDDLDTPRIRSGSIASVLEDLRWLGLDWDGPVLFQSHRRGIYSGVLSHLRRQGDLFPCRCSRRELAASRIYPGTCRDKTHGWGWEQQRLPAWRLRVAAAASQTCGDVVVRRADGFIAYHLATAVDELVCGITEVVRGADLAPARAAQMAVMAALDQGAPRYCHVPLLLDGSGEKLSKREASEGLAAWRERGARAEQVIGLLAEQLDLVPQSTVLSLQELLESVRSNPEDLEAVLEV